MCIFKFSYQIGGDWALGWVFLAIKRLRCFIEWNFGSEEKNQNKQKENETLVRNKGIGIKGIYWS